MCLYCLPFTWVGLQIACVNQICSPEISGISCQTFDSSRDYQETIFVLLAQIAGVKPSFFVKSIFSLFLLVQVTHEHVAAVHADLGVYKV